MEVSLIQLEAGQPAEAGFVDSLQVRYIEQLRRLRAVLVEQRVPVSHPMYKAVSRAWEVLDPESGRPAGRRR